MYQGLNITILKDLIYNIFLLYYFSKFNLKNLNYLYESQYKVVEAFY